MPGDLYAYICDNLDSMTGAGRIIAEYLVEHCDEAIRMSISELSARCDVGPSSVHRFCLSVGKPGYRDFILSLAGSARRRGVPESEDYDEPASEDPMEDMVAQLSNGLLRCVRDTRRLLSVSTLQKAVEALRGAEHIALFGMGDSMFASVIAYQRFMRAMTNVLCPQTYEGQLRLARALRPGDVAVLFPEAQSLTHAMELGRICSVKGAFIIGIACMKDTPLAALCTLYLPSICHNEAASVMRTSLRCAQDMLVEAICTAYENRYAVEDCSAYMPPSL